MTEENIKILEEKNVHLWFDGSPVAICSTILALDIDKAEIFASAKFLNVQPDNIKTVIFDIICYDAIRRPIDRIEDVAYTGFDVPRNEEFGYKRRVTVRNPQTRSVEYVLKSLSNATDDLWVNTEQRHFDTALEQQSIFAYQGDLNRQFLEICSRSNIDGTRFSFQPVFRENYWMCGCGCFNWAKEEECWHCGVGKSWLERNSQREVLEKQSEFVANQVARFHEEKPVLSDTAADKQAEKEEFERRKREYQKQLQKQKMKKSSKVVFLILLILAVLAAVGYGVWKYAIPYFQYTGAVYDFESYRFDDAIEKFTALGDFMESKDFRLKSIYGKAMSLNSEDPEQAMALFQSIIPYSDSYDQSLLSMQKLGEKKFAAKEYIEAADIFHALGEKSKEQECFSRIHSMALKNLAIDTLESLEAAREELTYIGDYRNAKELMQRCSYQLGNASYNTCAYAKAYAYYQEVPTFNDAPAKIKKLDMLMKLLGSAEEGVPAVWSGEGFYCTQCDKNTASYTLELGVDGSYAFYAECPEHEEALLKENGVYRMAQNVLHRRVGEKWEKIGKVISLKLEDNGDGMMVLSLIKPLDDRTPTIRLYRKGG